jgi:hypothetical protein
VDTLRLGATKTPEPLVCVLIATLVKTSVMVTVASGTTAPEESVTVPVMVALVDNCAESVGVKTSNAKKNSDATVVMRRSMDMFRFPPKLLILNGLLRPRRLPQSAAVKYDFREEIISRTEHYYA